MRHTLRPEHEVAGPANPPITGEAPCEAPPEVARPPREASMVRRGSTVRVRRRALQKRRKSALFFGIGLHELQYAVGMRAVYGAFRFQNTPFPWSRMLAPSRSSSRSAGRFPRNCCRDSAGGSRTRTPSRATPELPSLSGPFTRRVERGQERLRREPERLVLLPERLLPRPGRAGGRPGHRFGMRSRQATAYSPSPRSPRRRA